MPGQGKPGLAVLASHSDYGLVTKDQRGLYEDPVALVRPLADARQKLHGFFSRLGVSPDQSPRELAASIQSAIENRKQIVPTPAPQSPENGLEL